MSSFSITALPSSPASSLAKPPDFLPCCMPDTVLYFSPALPGAHPLNEPSLGDSAHAAFPARPTSPFPYLSPSDAYPSIKLPPGFPSSSKCSLFSLLPLFCSVHTTYPPTHAHTCTNAHSPTHWGHARRTPKTGMLHSLTAYLFAFLSSSFTRL